MHLSQLKDGGVVCRVGESAKRVRNAQTVYELAQEAMVANVSLAVLVEQRGLGEQVDMEALLAQGAFDCPMRHPDPAHMQISGTGLTHLGSASARDVMHQDQNTESMTDTMKMFQMGLSDGKPVAGEQGVQPEWFYKGSGHCAVAAGDDLCSPSFALDGGEEPEIAAFYLISDDGVPFRVGYSLCNEFSDHVTEKQNYLYLAHSKLRPVSFGAELLVGELPAHIEGVSRIWRDGAVHWEKEFLSGEDNMSHSIDNLEHHHFKYTQFRQPGDLQVHVFGTATLSVGDGIVCQPGDEFDISSAAFGLPLKNKLAVDAAEVVEVHSL